MPAPARWTSGTWGAGPSRLLTPWPARGTFSAPCSILDYQLCLSQGQAGQPLQPQPSLGTLTEVWTPGSLAEKPGERGLTDSASDRGGDRGGGD